MYHSFSNFTVRLIPIWRLLKLQDVALSAHAGGRPVGAGALREVWQHRQGCPDGLRRTVREAIMLCAACPEAAAAFGTCCTELSMTASQVSS